jgi:hypothetical protein
LVMIASTTVLDDDSSLDSFIYDRLKFLVSSTMTVPWTAPFTIFSSSWFRRRSSSFSWEGSASSAIINDCSSMAERPRGSLKDGRACWTREHSSHGYCSGNCCSFSTFFSLELGRMRHFFCISKCSRRRFSRLFNVHFKVKGRCQAFVCLHSTTSFWALIPS